MGKAMDKKRLFIFSFNIKIYQNIVFTGKLMLFSLLVFLWFQYTHPQYTGTYNASLIDKTERLMAAGGPGIVLIGNSNLVFGIDSELLEEKTGVPVVNMGLHGGLGNVFHEQMAKLNVRKGDIYIICHSDYNDEDNIADAQLAWLTIENHYQLWKLIRISDIKKMAQAFPVYLKKSLALYALGTGNQDSGGVYARSAFNSYGDCKLERKGSIFTSMEKVDAPGLNHNTIRRLNGLNQYLTRRGAVMLVAGYPIGSGELTADRQEFVKFQRRLAEALDCPVISDFEDYMYDYSYFYDYNYLHLNSEGAQLRTRQLIKDIRNWRKGYNQ